ncbi:thiaminase II [Halobacillus campisalis]|uniref:Aminopyrimidine aminohydrolase n=1 Tax=Halobacillus campisalis TaxID=435909 RepID=A0ABW2JZW4_9BACI|nr:thiaminase II [Halobacillus campisalis]
MSFTEMLRRENNDIFEAVFNHPFVEGIGKGDVPHDSIAHYIKADYEYLNAFMHIYGVGISKSTNRKDIEYFNEQVGFVLNSETHPHQNFCDVIGVGYDELQGYPLPPTADHYVKHMMYHAQLGGLGEILAAMLPCPWTYLEIGQHLMKKYQPGPDDTFYPWIKFYADEEFDTLSHAMRNRLDEVADEASEAERQRMKDAFRKSCQLEWKFWEMAYICEEWPQWKGVNSK